MRTPHLKHLERHFIARTGWLRAAVLGANDGILSTASILTGMAAGGATHSSLMLAGFAGLVAGATSMAAGEYVSVSSQSDIEKSDLAREKRELEVNPNGEHEELTRIYIARGLTSELASEVSRQLMAHNALEAHARDELGISEMIAANPLEAALSSCASFAAGAALPLLTAAFAPIGMLSYIVIGISVGALALLGILAAKTSGSPVWKPTMRVVIWGIVCMVLTALIGRLTGTVL